MTNNPTKAVQLTEREMHLITAALRAVAPILDNEQKDEDEHSKLYWKLLGANTFAMEREIEKWGNN